MFIEFTQIVDVIDQSTESGCGPSEYRKILVDIKNIESIVSITDNVLRVYFYNDSESINVKFIDLSTLLTSLNR